MCEPNRGETHPESLIHDFPAADPVCNPIPAPSADVQFKYAWDWFSYHATQRQLQLNYFIGISALVAAGYVKCVEDEMRLHAMSFAVFGAVVSLAFSFLDIRNLELLLCGRDTLQKFERSADARLVDASKSRTTLAEAAGLLSRVLPPGALRTFAQHRFWFRAVYLTALVIYVSAAFSAISGFGLPGPKPNPAVLQPPPGAAPHPESNPAHANAPTPKSVPGKPSKRAQTRADFKHRP